MVREIGFRSWRQDPGAGVQGIVEAGVQEAAGVEAAVASSAGAEVATPPAVRVRGAGEAAAPRLAGGPLRLAGARVPALRGRLA